MVSYKGLAEHLCCVTSRETVNQLNYLQNNHYAFLLHLQVILSKTVKKQRVTMASKKVFPI